MIRIAGVNLPEKKRIIIALQSIYGIGQSQAYKILKNSKIDINKKVNELKEKDFQLIRKELEKLTIEGELKREKQYNIKRLMEIACYRGIRHRKKLPVRGQRTKCNARTRKGVKKTVANKKKATK